MNVDAKFYQRAALLLLSLAALVFLARCGGGGTDVAGGGKGGTGISTGAITGFGSVVVNGVEFSVPPAAVITIDDSSASEADLLLGMVVMIRGKFNADGLTGEAERIRAADELEGPVTDGSITADSFVVLGQIVVVDGGTIFENDGGQGIGAISGGTFVEVHGLRKTGGTILATRVEVKNPGEEEIEVKGTVSDYAGGDTFKIGNLQVTIDNTPLPAGFGNGVFVEVEGVVTGPLSMTATEIEIEGNEVVEFVPFDGEKVEVEGFVSDFAGHPGTFKVGNMTVTTTAGTRFEGGVPSDLANDVRVEAEGRMEGVNFVAGEIEFK